MIPLGMRLLFKLQKDIIVFTQLCWFLNTCVNKKSRSPAKSAMTTTFPCKSSVKHSPVNLLREYPSESKLIETRDKLKPSGILSNNYHSCQLKKVERPFVSSKEVEVISTISEKMHQTNYSDQEKLPDNSGYFNVTTKRHTMSTYDRINHVNMGYNQSLHRDDREHANSYGLKVHEEEHKRLVPATTNALYGHPKLQLVDRLERSHGRADVCKQDFYRLNGVNAEHSKE